MATIRAYKLAEELGIERSEFVEKAATLGVVLKNAMAQIEDDVANELREKLGARTERGPVTERRVEQSGGAAVIRRRKKAEAEPVLEPVVEAPAPSLREVLPEPTSAPEPIVAEPETTTGPEAEPEAEQAT